MTTHNNSSVKSFFEKEVLPLFPMQEGEISWLGSSDFDFDSLVHYFRKGSVNYIILSRSHLGSANEMEDDMVPSHQKAELIQPINTTYPNIYISGSDHPLGEPCYISLYRITNKTP